MLAPNAPVGANLRLVRVLGEGGMGSVWLADHLTLKAPVAVKFMAQGLASNDEAVARFSREAAAAAQIKSPHVVQVFDHGFTEERVPYIVMELLEGEDLACRIAQRGRLSAAEVSVIVTQAAKALTRAHALGIVHRDIKPENVFLCYSDGDVLVKVLDFGIAKQVDSATFNMTSTGAMVGTPYYMSPEQVLSAKRVDYRCDLWSLAVVAYFALTGEQPFAAETMGGLMVAIERATFRKPSEVVSGLSPSIDAWFTRALRRDPAARFGSAREMADALGAAVSGASTPVVQSVAVGGGGSVAAAPPSPSFATPAVTSASATMGGTAAPADQRRRRSLLGAIAALSAAGVAVIAVGAWASRAYLAPAPAASSVRLVASETPPPSVTGDPVQTAVAPTSPPEPAPAPTASPSATAKPAAPRPAPRPPPPRSSATSHPAPTGRDHDF